MPSNIEWGSVADWVSGLGSLAAGVIALYLARASERIRLKGYIGVRLIVGGGMPTVELVSVSVTNVGTRSTVVNNISMTVGRFRKKRHAVITVVKDTYSVGVPYPLADGQQAHWGIPMGQDKKWLRDLCDGFIKTDSDVRSLRFRVHTNHGYALTLKPEEPMLEELLKVVSAQSKAPASGT